MSTSNSGGLKFSCSLTTLDAGISLFNSATLSKRGPFSFLVMLLLPQISERQCPRLVDNRPPGTSTLTSQRLRHSSMSPFLRQSSGAPGILYLALAWVECGLISLLWAFTTFSSSGKNNLWSMFHHLPQKESTPRMLQGETDSIVRRTASATKEEERWRVHCPRTHATLRVGLTFKVMLWYLKTCFSNCRSTLLL